MCAGLPAAGISSAAAFERLGNAMSEDRTSNAAGDAAPEEFAPEPGGGLPDEAVSGSGEAGGWAEERLRRIDSLLDMVEEKLGERNFRPSVGDFVRLLQLRKELEDERPREITVTWVEPSGDEDASAE